MNSKGQPGFIISGCNLDNIHYADDTERTIRLVIQERPKERTNC